MIVLKISSILWLVLYFDPVRSSGKSYSQEPYWKWTSAGQLSQNKRGRSSATADTLHSNLDLWWSLYDAAFSAIRPYRRDSPIQWTSRPINLDNVGAEETLELGKVFKLSHGPRRKRDSKWNAENEQKMFAVDPLFGIPIVVTKRPTSPMGTGDRPRQTPSRSFLEKIEDLEFLERSIEVQENVLPPNVVQKTAESKFLSQQNLGNGVVHENETLPKQQPWRPYSPNYQGNQIQRRCHFEGTNGTEIF